eukprot:352775-Chlamydomonas_euryale.AAC.17
MSNPAPCSRSPASSAPVMTASRSVSSGAVTVRDAAPASAPATRWPHGDWLASCRSCGATLVSRSQLAPVDIQ